MTRPLMDLGEPTKKLLALASRASEAEVRAASDRVASDHLLSVMLEAIPVSAAVLNTHRQLVLANSRMATALGLDRSLPIDGKRVGELLGCERAGDAPAGCGTSKACEFCGVVNATVEALRSNRSVSREARISMGHGALDVEVLATPTELDGTRFVLVALRDISADKRRRVLERLFFHDVLNTAGGICGVARLLLEASDQTVETEFKQLLVNLSENLVDEINGQRQLMAAESGELQTSPVELSVTDVLEDVRSLYANHPSATAKRLVVQPPEPAILISDVTLLRRVLGNMVKNALEASREGGAVTLSSNADNDRVCLSVHNDGGMAEAVRLQVFQRSFSTKGAGRGIGTYSIKLLGERYLGGKVTFASDDQHGTTFTICLPCSWQGRRSRE